MIFFFQQKVLDVIFSVKKLTGFSLYFWSGTGTSDNVFFLTSVFDEKNIFDNYDIFS